MARGQTCQVLRYSFQPDCLHEPGDPACTLVFYGVDSSSHRTVDRMDLGPQIAVWIESADGTQFIDTLMVTNMVAARGIGNRPGLSLLVSSPKFPYGKRQMALPIWAHARGKLYPSVVFQDGEESRIGFHESVSSPDPYFCRPMTPEEIVDAITCPSPVFNSSKGRLDPTHQVYYPPRNDLGSDASTFTSRDCDNVGGAIGNCNVSSEGYAVQDDLDAVAAATPLYGQTYEGFWYVPPGVTAGSYAVRVEVNKEFDTNASHQHPAMKDLQSLGAYGLTGNFGQPSVVYRVAISLDGSSAAVGTASEIEGYSDWTGTDGDLRPRDSSISVDPGSGEGRLVALDGPGGPGRVHVTLEPCVCDPPPAPPLGVTFHPVFPDDLSASKATLSFIQGVANGSPVFRYEIRYLATDALTMSADEFSQATSGPRVSPAQPLDVASFSLENLKPSTHYLVGIRAEGPCRVQSDIAFVDFVTAGMKFTQLSGCFVATAAFGSEMEPEVAALRSVRDELRPQSALFAAAIELYYRSGPAAAAVIQRSDTLRALARRLLAPAAGLAEVADGAKAALLR